MYVVPPPESGSNSASDNLRVYQTWKGSNVFFLQGRFIFGPDARSLGLTVLLIVAPVLIFCIFVARKLMDDFSHHLGVSIMVVAVVFTFYVLVLLLLTSGRDPGIIPPNAHPPEPEVTGGTTPEVGAGQTPQLRLPRFKEVNINGITVKTKYCDSCMLYRPPRCSHCSICNNCVERFDHHCPWVGQCIGQRNYRFFFMFVFSTTLLCIYVFAFCCVYIKKIMVGERTTVWKAMIKTPASIVLLSYTIIAVWFVSGLSAFHLYLISTNQTTYENFRYRYDWRDNPYNKGVVQNFMEVFCTSIPSSKNKFRAKVTRDPGLANQPEVGGFVSPNMGKAVEEIEVGRKAVWNELDSGADHNEGQLVGEDGLMDVKDRMGELHPEIRTPMENKVDGDHAGTNPRRSSWGRKSGSWEMSPEVLALAGRVGESNHAPGSSSGSMNANRQGEQ